MDFIVEEIDDSVDPSTRWLNSWVKCSCGCRRKVKNCKRYIETESWEMPWIKYEICVCPKCGNDMEESY